ncbi:scoloptoxin SSD14 isoform X2 [Cherax quadricarinatus]
MGRRSKRLRAQLYQYSQDETGSYSVITQWPPPSSPSTPPRQRISQRRALACVAAAFISLILVAVGVTLGLTRDRWAATSNSSSSHSSEPGNLWRSFSRPQEEVATGPSLSSASQHGLFNRAAVATDTGQPCAHIAMEILGNSGSAADATIAGLLCAGVINAQSVGLGGGFLLIYYERATGKAYSLNAMTSDPPPAQGDSVGRGSVRLSVPGTAHGYRQLYKQLGGRVPWEHLLEPTITLCENGYTVTSSLARALRSASQNIYSQPSMSVFVNPATGKVFQEGDTMRRPQLARTLRLLQQDPDSLYTGSLAKDLAKDLGDLDSSLELQDLRSYSSVWKKPVSVSLQHGNLTMYSVGPPGSGLTLGFLLNLLDEFGLSPGNVSEANTVLTHHLLAHILKWTFTKKVQLDNTDRLAHDLTSDAFAASVRHQILDDMNFHDSGHYGAAPGMADDLGTAHSSLDDCGTSQFSLLAPNGDAISVTSTLNSCLGAAMRSPRTGIIFSSTKVDHSHRPYPTTPDGSSNTQGKQRVSSPMAPAVVVDGRGEVRLVLGEAGGGLSSSGVWWTALRYLWLHEDLKSAVGAPRLHLTPSWTLVSEEGFSPKVITGLQDVGHRIRKQELGKTDTAVYAVAREQDGKVQAVSDLRSPGGTVDGF